MPGREKELTCSWCGERLNKYTCPWCRGRRTERKFLFFRGACENCEGTGVVYKCPNWKVHEEQLRANFSKEFTFKKTYQTKKQKCTKCDGRRYVYILSLGRPIMCPKCQGTGVMTAGLTGLSGTKVRKKLCPTCGGTRGIITPTGPKGGPRTIGCPRCHGKGFID